ncbi:hypothetical protein N9R89_02515 [bacterium]|jgi:hypothetical protein|nr:hypothetical protein [bacterium]
MKKITGSIFVCLILATSAMAQTGMHPLPQLILSNGKILSVQHHSKGSVVKFVIAYLGDIYMCRHSDLGKQNSDVFCKISRPAS